MSKPTLRYVCQECGASFGRWMGKCEACGAWNSIVEEAPRESQPKGLGAKHGGRRIDFVGLKGASTPPPRLLSGISELDRVMGGGLVAGSALLVGGDPGIGKSTLLLQAMANFSKKARAIYISGEEAIDQVRLRAQRLGLDDAEVLLASASDLRNIAASLEDASLPAVVVIDSIQTVYLDSLDSAPGTVAQVRASAAELIRMAKRRGFALFLIGHVTKEGQIAGPRVLEHMVDTVLYFEGERGHQFRILRAVKNRFGATDEIGVFEMTDAGLVGVANPSALFLAERRGNVSGSCVFAGIEGTRPVLMEIQALLAPSTYSTPRRAVIGWDAGRLSMIMAVLDARCGLALGGNDVYLNVAGGMKISEPAADLAVATALLSSLSGIPAPANMAVFGEIGLSGEVRAVSQSDARLKESAKLGFSQALIPAARKGAASTENAMEIRRIGHVQDLAALFADKGRTGKNGKQRELKP
ncbi:DNA repair protein RadA [Alphaproteobacteria bacterium]|nr:DNA repair protein RadA [Alphaproteobacteria bacterium]